MACREGEIDRTWFRSSRFFRVNGKWYFISRDNPCYGPFDCRSDAEIELLFYMKDQGYLHSEALPDAIKFH